MKRTARSRRRKPYTAPRLRTYGDVRKITQGGTMRKDETGQLRGPSTKP